MVTRGRGILEPPRRSLQQSLLELYEGRSRQAVRFQTGLLILDLLAIVFFIIGSFLHHSAPLYVVEVILAALFLVDYVARLSISDRRIAFVLHPVSLADLIVIVSLFTALIYENFAFLRVLRALRLLRTYHALAQLRRRYPFFAAHQDVFTSIVSLIVFLFVVTALVYVFQVNVNPKIENYVDALYFTVTTLSTTGFGDITLVGTTGKLLSVLIMVLGISLFLRLIQTLFRPSKIHYECPSCGLSRHDPDAAHCKRCGTLIKIGAESD